MPTEGRHWILPIARRAGLPADSAASLRAGTSAEQAWADVARSAGLSDAELAGRIAEAYRLKVADLASADPMVLRLVPSITARGRGVFPLRQSDHDLVVAASNPIDPDTEAELEEMTGRTPVFEIATPRDISAAILAHYPSRLFAPAPRRISPNVLIADDDVVARTMAKALLEKHGFTVFEAADGRAALALLEREDVSLAVLDIEMPEMNGLDVLRRIRRKPATASLPVVVLSISDDLAALEAGADDYVRKPYAPARFLARIKAALRRASN